MNGFAWALTAFVLLHVGISATGLRGRLVGALGEGLYRALFALASIGLIAWLGFSFVGMRADPFDPLNVPLWAPPGWLHWPGVVINLLGLTLAAAGVLTASPTRIGNEAKGLALPEPAVGIIRITRHPFMWGAALWGLGHLLLNGERWAIMLFGALAAMALFGSRSIDRKGRARDPEAWDRFAAVTSNAPFAAILQGRNRLDLREIGWRALAGVAIAFVIALAHDPLIGAPAFSTSP